MTVTGLGPCAPTMLQGHYILICMSDFMYKLIKLTLMSGLLMQIYRQYIYKMMEVACFASKPTSINSYIHSR